MLHDRKCFCTLIAAVKTLAYFGTGQCNGPAFWCDVVFKMSDVFIPSKALGVEHFPNWGPNFSFHLAASPCLRNAPLYRSYPTHKYVLIFGLCFLGQLWCIFFLGYERCPFGDGGGFRVYETLEALDSFKVLHLFEVCSPPTVECVMGFHATCWWLCFHFLYGSYMLMSRNDQVLLFESKRQKQVPPNSWSKLQPLLWILVRLDISFLLRAWLL